MSLLKFGKKSIPPHHQISDAMQSRDVALIRRMFIKFPEELNNPDAILGCHLHDACGVGDLDCIKAIVDFGGDINLKDDRDGVAPIGRACGIVSVEIVKYILSLGCELDVSTSLRNPLFGCIASILPRNDYYGKSAGFADRNEVSAAMLEIAHLLIDHGIDLTACYIQQSMVDMDASAFAFMMGQVEIGEAVITALYGHDVRLAAGARAEALEVAVGNGWSRQKFRKRRYPPKRGKDNDALPQEGEFWV